MTCYQRSVLIVPRRTLEDCSRAKKGNLLFQRLSNEAYMIVVSGPYTHKSIHVGRYVITALPQSLLPSPEPIVPWHSEQGVW